MATLNFDESIVLMLFAQAIGPDVRHAAVIGFDAQLQKDFGEMMLGIMKDEGLEIDVHSRSLVVGLRPFMNGTTSQLKIRNACRFVLKARQELAGPLRAAAMVAAPASAARTSRARKSASRRRTSRTRAGRSAGGSRRQAE